MGAKLEPSAIGRNVAMLGLGVYRPSRVVTNEEICQTIDSSDEWIRTRSGIHNRRFASDEETVVMMSIEAGRKALEASGISPEQVGAVIVATSTHNVQTPQAASVVAHELGMNGPAAFDLHGGCAGFCSALGVAADLVRAGTAEHVLVVGAENMTLALDMHDRSISFIFGDGAGAVIVGASEENGIGPVTWGSDGSQSDAIHQEPTWSEFLHHPDAEHRPFIKMAGTAVFRWAAFEMGKVAKEALAKTHMSTEDLDVFVPHQANARINEVIARTLKLPESIAVAGDIEETGNTSAASIPLAMEEMLRTGKSKPGDTALLLAFGAGLSYAAQVATMPVLAQ
jgi:beta-ketoacyl ACP synthase